MGVAMGQRLPVRLSQFSIYDKPMSGYEILLPGNLQQMRESLLAHLDAHVASVSVYEDMVLCEEVRYAPISVWQPITLVFVLEQASPMLTRFKAAGLLQYREPIGVRNQPDLALRLLLDLDQFVRGATGDSLGFDALFLGLSAEDLLRQYESRKAQEQWSFYVERRADEVIERPGLFLREGRMPSDSLPKRMADDAVVEELARRFRQYAHSGTDSPFLDDDAQSLTATYRDSLAQLHTALTSARNINQLLVQERDSIAEAWIRVQSQAGSMPEVVQERLQALETENAQLRAQVGLTADVPRCDSLDFLQEEIARQSEAIKTLREQVQGYQQALLSKDQELDIVFSRLARMERQASTANKPNEDGLERLMNETARREDSLLESNEQLNASLARQARVQDSLQRLILALNPGSEQAKARQAIYLRQLRRLETAQQDLTERGWDVSMREKRIRQREAFLAEYESDRDQERLMRRISSLEEQVAKLTQGRVIPESGGSSVLVEMASIRIGVLEVPAYSVRSSLPTVWAQEQLRSWARMYGIELQEGDPMVIVSSELPGMEGVRYRWQLSFRSRGRESIVYCTFQTPDGSYLDLQDGGLESKQAHLLLQRAFE